ncbi:heterokaryon incompatibility protein-domain-containing protein [Xylariales sp. PMI_506]|nr:heterokaryon incompatibility protein-domain-containing protein [Xylariales sp. PMI_506]
MESQQPNPEEWRTHLYAQAPLRKPNGYIRLLTIQSRRYAASMPSTETVQCVLKLANLKEDPKFTAISHSCPTKLGEDTPRTSILVNGTSIEVSQDLFEALRHLQMEDDSVTVWVDAICSNQADVEERAAEAAQISDIFSAATTSVIWIGPPAEGSDEAMTAFGRLVDERFTPVAQQLVQSIAHKSAVVVKGIDHPPQTNDAVSTPSQGLEDLLMSLRTAFGALMGRAYWSRFWSLQELVFTQKGHVVCGDKRVDVDKFYQAGKALDGILNMATYSEWLSSTRSSTTPAPPDITEPANFSQSPAIRLLSERDYFRSGRGWFASTEHQLFSVLERYFFSSPEPRIGLVAQDPRDLIFGLLGLSTDAKELGLVIDYAKDCDQVYLDTATALLRQSPKLLRACQESARPNSTPSWVVDWRKTKRAWTRNYGSSSNACGPADERFYRADTSVPGVVSLKGVMIDTIEEIQAASEDQSSSREELQAAIKSLMERTLEMPNSPYTANQSLEIPSDMAACSTFLSKNGYVGFVPVAASTGDTIAVLYGSGVPFALKLESNGAYRVIGEAYVLGIMEGEFMKSHRREEVIRLS